MKQAVVGISKALMKGIYRLCCACTSRVNEAVFLSRQADQPTYDFVQFARQFEDAGWATSMHVKKIRASGGTGSQEGGAGMVAYALHVLRELRLLARCRVVVLDRYDPVVSLLDFACQPDGESSSPAAGEPAEDGGGAEDASVSGSSPAAGEPHAAATQASGAGKAAFGMHRQFPSEPVVVQAWHAFGAFKKFGDQTAGTREGHDAGTLDTFNIHRNYTWILCSSELARAAFAEAFAYPVERLVAFSRPEYFLLTGAAEGDRPDAETAGGPRVLVAPTLRMNSESAHPLRDLHSQGAAFAQDVDAQVDWSFHPLEEGLEAPRGVNPALFAADVVVTDYSSIAYDAYLLDKPVVFFVPDHSQYCQAPGLNADPLELCPDLCCETYEALVAAVRRVLSSPEAALASLAPFAAPAFENAETLPNNLPKFLAEKGLFPAE